MVQNTLVEFNGTLAFVHDVRVNQNMYSSIWLLTDPDKGVWVKQYTRIPMPKDHCPPVKPLGSLLDGRILVRSSMFDNEETRQRSPKVDRRREVILLYDPSTKEFTDFVEIPEGFRYTLVLYTGSLLS